MRSPTRVYTNRWFLKHAAALFCAALLAFGLSASASVAALLSGQIWIPKQIDQGWAALLGATIGLSVVGMQARIGFRHLRESQVHQARLARLAQYEQAQLNREARRDQFDLQTEHENQLTLRDKKALAAALNGELLAVYAYLNNRAHVINLQKIVYESMPRNTLIPGAKIEVIGAKTPIFDASISKMGLLDPSLISDTTELFQSAKTDISNPADKIPAEIIAKMLGTIAEGWQTTRLDFLHLQKRLISVQYGTVDPGARILARQTDILEK